MGRGNGVPTVAGSWLFGSARALQRDQLGTYERARRAHGPIARFRIGPPRVGFEFDAVFDPTGARAVLSSRSCTKDVPVFAEFARLFGANLASLDGDRWLAHRRIVQPLLTRRRVAGHLSVIARAAHQLVESWDVPAGANGTVDLAVESARYALSALGRTLFGGDLQDAVPILHHQAPVLNEHAARRGLAPVRTPPSWPTPANRRAARAQRSVHDLVEGLIRRRRAEGGDDLLTLLLGATDPDTGQQLTDREVRDEALGFFLAGYETTAAALALTLDLLARHPRIQDRVREEVRSQLGQGALAVDDLKAMAYTAQVVQEAMRLYPPVPTLVRRAVDGIEVSGHNLPPGRIVAVSVWGIHRNPQVWPDPERFDPDRFTTQRTADRDRYAHLPFGGGPRTCVGAHLALTELVTMVAAVVRAHRLQPVNGASEPALAHDITLRPRGELPCRLDPISS